MRYGKAGHGARREYEEQAEREKPREPWSYAKHDDEYWQHQRQQRREARQERRQEYRQAPQPAPF